MYTEKNKGMRETSLKFEKKKIDVPVALKSHPIFTLNKTTSYSL